MRCQPGLIVFPATMHTLYFNVLSLLAPGARSSSSDAFIHRLHNLGYRPPGSGIELLWAGYGGLPSPARESCHRWLTYLQK